MIQPIAEYDICFRKGSCGQQPPHGSGNGKGIVKNTERIRIHLKFELQKLSAYIFRKAGTEKHHPGGMAYPYIRYGDIYNCPKIHLIISLLYFGAWSIYDKTISSQK
jgi:hypothetical protein